MRGFPRPIVKEPRSTHAAVLSEQERRSVLLARDENLGLTTAVGPSGARKILVIDDSATLLNVAKKILAEADYEVTTAATAEEGLRAASAETPHLILLDCALSDMPGDEVLRRLTEEPATAASRVIYMSSSAGDLKFVPKQNPNVIGSLNKPFTSELLLQTVETHMAEETAASKATPADRGAEKLHGVSPTETGELLPASSIAPEAEIIREAPAESAKAEASKNATEESWWSAAPATIPAACADALTAATSEATTELGVSATPDASRNIEFQIPPGVAYFCGDTTFFSLNWALRTIASQKLTGRLRCFWNREPVELLSRDGEILIVTTRDPELYYTEAPITLVNVEQDCITAARDQQRENGRPIFMTLTDEDQILREPALQLMQHYGQKLFAQLWTTPPVRFVFERAEVPPYAQDLTGEEDVDHWSLGTLRFIQFHELGEQANYDPAFIPAYTREGFDRVQRLRLTVAEAQFASEFNGSRSIAQIAKNLRVDLKFARLTLFRFLALEIVECWPPVVAAKQERRGVFSRIFSR